MIFFPNPGPQTDAYLSEADELFYGGSAGCGKSALLCGLAINEHNQSRILRREFSQVKGLEDEVARMLSTREGYNGQSKIWRLPKGNVLEFGAVQYEDDKEKYQGRAADFLGFDEVSHFTKSQYEFLIGWNRSAKPGQRCRIVCAGNPPTRPEGFWVVERWAPWLDPKHPNPAKPGELRWFTTVGGKDIEVQGKGPHTIDGKELYARSRTFIPGKLEDNPDLMKSGYAATLEAMPEPYRTMLREGRFDVTLEDDHWQTIPTQWVRDAMSRWTPTPPVGVPMCSMGIDIAQGGSDNTVIAMRYDGWFAPLVVVPGVQTPDGPTAAGIVVQHRKDGALPILDMGGGYGGDTFRCLKDNGINCKTYKGATGSTSRTKDKQLGFTNQRSEAYWKFREALDPSQLGGSPVMLPDDPALLADLCAPTFQVIPRGIQIEAKEEVCKRLSRSTDRGDAVIMAWSEGVRGIDPKSARWQNDGRNNRPKLITGHDAKRRNTNE